MKLIEYIEKEKNNIQNYSLTEEMKVYTGTPQESVLISKVQPGYHSILGYSNGHLVTFFVLDSGEDKYLYTENTDAMLLKSFSTDSRYLRQGYAIKTLQLLPDFVQAHYSDIDEIVLGVNVKNKSAQHLYLKTGFSDHGVRRMGEKGVLMVLTLSFK